MSGFLDLNNPMIRAMVFVQVIGFPLAFLIRAAMHAYRAKRQTGKERTISVTRVAYYVCFALMSIGFYFYKPVGIIFFVAGLGLLVRQFYLSRKSSVAEAVKAAPAKPISIRSTRLTKRRVQS